MKFEIKTAKLNEMLDKVGKGVGNNKLLPITSFIKVKLDQQKLEITATDVNNYITVAETITGADFGTFVVPAEQFIKLVGKTTAETIKFELMEDCVMVKGNGAYKLPILQEEFPTYETLTGDVVTVDVPVLKGMLGINKASVASDISVPCLMGYYVGDKAVTTNGVKVCINTVAMFDTPVLLTQEMANLIATLTADKVQVTRDGGRIMLTTDNVTIYGAELEGLEEYPDVSGVMGMEYASVCKLSTLAVAAVLDRLNLFVSQYDENAILINFTAEGVVFNDLNNGGCEVVSYLENSNFAELTVKVNIALLAAQVATIQGESFYLHYGHDKAIKMVDGGVYHVLCVMNMEG